MEAEARLRQEVQRILAECGILPEPEQFGCIVTKLSGLSQDLRIAAELLIFKGRRLGVAEAEFDERRERRNFWFFGIGFFLFVVITVLVPNPTPYQEFSFRVFASIVSAGVGYNIPGFLSVDWRATWGKKVNAQIKAGGAIAIFIVVFLINPPAILHR